MKNSLRFMAIALMAAITLSSCSQSKDLSASKSTPPSPQYHRVYIGNKVVYHDVDAKEVPKQKKEQSTLPKKGAPVASLNDNTSEASSPEVSMEKIKNVKINRSEKEKNAAQKKGLIATFKENTRQMEDDFSSGHIFKKAEKADASENTEAAPVDAYAIFAILGFAFGVLGLFNIVFAILGLIFSILGYNSSWKVFAVIGLILSIVGLALFVADHID